MASVIVSEGEMAKMSLSPSGECLLVWCGQAGMYCGTHFTESEHSRDTLDSVERRLGDRVPHSLSPLSSHFVYPRRVERRLCSSPEMLSAVSPFGSHLCPIVVCSLQERLSNSIGLVGLQ